MPTYRDKNGELVDINESEQGYVPGRATTAGNRPVTAATTQYNQSRPLSGSQVINQGATGGTSKIGDQNAALLKQYQDYLAKSAAGLDEARAWDPQARAQQQAQIDALRAAAEGRGPSAAQAQMVQGANMARRAAASRAASMAGVNPALAARMGLAAGAGAAGDIVGQTAALRAQEQANARNQLTQAIYGLRNQDQSRLGQEGQLTTAQQQLAMNAQYTPQQLDQQMRIAAMQANTARDVAAMQQPSKPSTFETILGGIGMAAPALGPITQLFKSNSGGNRAPAGWYDEGEMDRKGW